MITEFKIISKLTNLTESKTLYIRSIYAILKDPPPLYFNYQKVSEKIGRNPSYNIHKKDRCECAKK